MLNKDHWEITFSDDFDELKGDIIFANQPLLDYLEQHEQLIIEGNQDEPLVFNINNNNFKMKGVYLPTTLLATKALNPSQSQHPFQGENGFESSKNILSVYLQKGNYLKIESYQIEYHKIYAELTYQSLKHAQFKQLETIEDIITEHAISLTEILHQYKLTNKQLQEIQRYSPFVVFRKEDIDSLSVNVVLSMDVSLLLALFRELIPFLTQHSLLGEFFTYHQIQDTINFKHEKILIAMAKAFFLQTNYNNQQLSEQAMQIESYDNTKKYKVNIQSLIHFILVQLALTKKQHHMKEMDHQISNLLYTYLPAGNDQFQYDKAKVKVAQLIGYYFFTIIEYPQSKRVYYNPFLLESNIKDRVQFMNQYKKKFTLSQIKGVMRGMQNVQMEIGQILIKYFRKCGTQYQIKLVIPK